MTCVSELVRETEGGVYYVTAPVSNIITDHISILEREQNEKPTMYILCANGAISFFIIMLKLIYGRNGNLAT